MTCHSEVKEYVSKSDLSSCQRGGALLSCVISSRYTTPRAPLPIFSDLIPDLLFTTYTVFFSSDTLFCIQKTYRLTLSNVFLSIFSNSVKMASEGRGQVSPASFRTAVYHHLLQFFLFFLSGLSILFEFGPRIRSA